MRLVSVKKIWHNTFPPHFTFSWLQTLIVSISALISAWDQWWCYRINAGLCFSAVTSILCSWSSERKHVNTAPVTLTHFAPPLLNPWAIPAWCWVDTWPTTAQSRDCGTPKQHRRNEVAEQSVPAGEQRCLHGPVSSLIQEQLSGLRWSIPALLRLLLIFKSIQPLIISLQRLFVNEGTVKISIWCLCKHNTLHASQTLIYKIVITVKKKKSHCSRFLKTFLGFVVVVLFFTIHLH